MRTATLTGEDKAHSAQRQANARLAGAAYLLTIIAGMFAEVYARATLRVPSDPRATAANIVAGETLYRFSIFADLTMLASYVVVTALLYQTFKGAGRALSLTAALFSVIGIALLAAATGLLAAPLILVGDAGYLSAFPGEQREVLAYVMLRMHGEFYSYTGFFFGLYCLSIGSLALRSRDLPRPVGWLMVLAGATFLVDTTLELVAPSIARQVPDIVLIISLLGEGTFAIWLTLFGIGRPSLMTSTAETPSADEVSE